MDTSDFIIRYRVAFSKEDCKEIIKHIEHLESNNLLHYDDTATHLEDHKVVTVNNDYDLVSGWKKKRFDPITKTLPSKFFNFVTRVFSGIKLNDFNCGIKAYKKSVVKSISIYGEMHRYIPLIAKWNGFNNIGEKEVNHNKRKLGVTKFGMER